MLYSSPRILHAARHLSVRANLGNVALLGRRKPRQCPLVGREKSVKVNALDAAMPFDFESRAAAKMKAEKSLKIGIVGFGSFGQFLARRIAHQGHKVLAVSRTDYSTEAKEMGVQFFTCHDDFAEQHPDVVILATSILSTKTVLEKLPLLRFRRSTLFVDVLSVKVFPKQVLLELLPDTMDVLCTHPMFGPDSGKGSWTGLNFMFEQVRVAEGDSRTGRIENFLDIFRTEGCNMVEMTCEEHDQQAANTQFITHTVGRILGAMELSSTPINTRGYESLLSLVENTANDTFDLYYGLFMYNQVECIPRQFEEDLSMISNSMETLEALEHAFDDVKRQLFSELHKVVRKQVFPNDTSKQLQLPVARPDTAPAPTTLADAQPDSTNPESNGAKADKARAGT